MLLNTTLTWHDAPERNTPVIWLLCDWVVQQTKMLKLGKCTEWIQILQKATCMHDHPIGCRQCRQAKHACCMSEQALQQHANVYPAWHAIHISCSERHFCMSLDCTLFNSRDCSTQAHAIQTLGQMSLLQTWPLTCCVLMPTAVQVAIPTSHCK